METTPSAGLGTTPPAALETTPYAGLVTRAIALLVDAIVINVIALIAGAVLALIGSLLGVGNLGIAAALTGGFLWLGWTGLYFIVFWIATGQTPGARLLGTRVVSASPRPLGIVRASLRFVVMMLALIPLGAGFLTVLFDDRRRGPHDMVADTVARWAPAGPPALAESPAPARAPVAASAATAASPSLATAPLAAAPPTPATAPSPSSPAPAAASPPTQARAHTAGPTAPSAPVVGEVVGPARDDEADGRVTPAAQAGPRLATEQTPPTRFESRPGA
jgi:uncharacterized RDD family membrane protein YckC